MPNLRFAKLQTFSSSMENADLVLNDFLCSRLSGMSIMSAEELALLADDLERHWRQADGFPEDSDMISTSNGFLVQ